MRGTCIDPNLDTLDIKREGAFIRYSEKWKANGTNVNFVKPNADQSLSVRTYERGVEDETLSCGTGVTAVAEIWLRLHPEVSQPIQIKTPGGILFIHSKPGEEPFLEGPAEFVFAGEWSI